MKNFDNPNDLAAIRTRVATLMPSDRALWGRMNVAQMICHLGDSFGVPLGSIASAPVRIAPLPTPVLKWIAFRSPLRWRPNMPTLPEIKHDLGGTRPGEFQADLNRLSIRLYAFLDHHEPWSPHPFFGDLSTWEWMRWAYLHFDHHLRQFGR